jgi:hypothetical protein
MAAESYNILSMFTLLNKNAIFTQIANSISVSSDSPYELLKDVQDVFIYSTLNHGGVWAQQSITIVRTCHCLIVNVCFKSKLSLSISDCSFVY